LPAVSSLSFGSNGLSFSTMARDAITLFARVRVDLLTMPLEPIKFPLEGSSLGSEPFDRFLVDSVTMVILSGDAP
jgi:hypothetical protein